MQQVKGQPIRFAAFVRQREQRRVKLLDDPINRLIIRFVPTLLAGNLTSLPMHESHRRRRFAQGQPFNYFFERRRQRARSPVIRPCLTRQADQSRAAILREPTLHRPARQTVLTRHRC